MKKYRFLPLSLLAMLFITTIGCPDIGMESNKIPVITPSFKSPYRNDNRYHYGAAADVGTVEIPFEITLELTLGSTSEHYSPPAPMQIFFSFSGYGSLYLYDDSATPSTLTQLEPSQEYTWQYTGLAIKGLYRPPSIDEIRELKDTLSYFIGGELDCRFFEKNWDMWMKEKYKLSIRLWNEPTEFYLDHFNLGEYEQNNQPVNVTVVAGETYECSLILKPDYFESFFYYGNYGLIDQNNYSWANLGYLRLLEPILEPWFVTLPLLGEMKYFVGKYPCVYTASKDITSPTDITAIFGISDPWDGQGHEIKLIFHVVPK